MKIRNLQLILLLSSILNFVFLLIIEFLCDHYIVLRSDYFATAKPIGKYYFLTCEDVPSLKKILLDQIGEVNLKDNFKNQYLPNGSYNKAKHADLIINELDDMEKRRTIPVK